MHPQIQRPAPVWRQLVDFYRDQITEGAMTNGDRLPPVREIADSWGVAHTTVAKALRQLAAEHLITTSNQGSVVTWGEEHTFSPRGRLRAMKAARHYAGGPSRIVGSELVSAPDHVAEAMGIEPGTSVIRRERVTKSIDETTDVERSITWLPGSLAEEIPELLSTERLPGGTVAVIEARTERSVESDTYRERAVYADPETAAALGVPEGSPVLHGQNWWREQDGSVLEFGEFYIREGQWLVVS
ncbi:GntR family transcriptional regulator [Nocardia sp. NPDC003963]